MLPVAGGWGNLNGNSATMHRCVNEEHTVKGLFGRLKGTEYISVKQQATVLHDAAAEKCVQRNTMLNKRSYM